MTTLLIILIALEAVAIVLAMVILSKHADQLKAISEWAEQQEEINHEMALWIKQHDQQQHAQFN